MPKAWKDVIASQQYQALPPEQKAQAQEQYFNEVVAPQAGDKADAARQQFFSAYPVSTAQSASSMWQDAPRPTEQSQSWGDAQPQSRLQQLGSGLAETGRGILQAGANVANIPAMLTDAVVSSAAWAGDKIGIGDGTYIPAPRVTTEGLEKDFGLQPGTLTPQTTEGKIFSEVLPYLTPIGAERVATQAPNLLARAARAVPRLAAENTTGALAANSGEDGSVNGFVGDLALGVGLGGVINAAAKGVGKAANYVGNKYLREAGEKLRKVITQGVQPSTLETTAKAVSEANETSILRHNISITNAAGDAANVTPQSYRALEEVRPNYSVLDSAKRLGVDEQLIPSHFSNNPTYIAIEQGLKSVPASQLAAQEQKAIASLAQKADDLIESAGGTQSRAALSDKFKVESSRAIDDLSASSDKIYGEISAAIPPRTMAEANNTVALLRSKATDLGGPENLSAAEKMVLKRLGGKVVTNADGTTSTIPPTYALLDNTRKQIGAAIGKNEGPFKDQTTAELSSLYQAITNDQKVVADSLGMGGKWDVAKNLVSQRKELEEKMAYALGKDLTGTFTSKLTPAIQNLRKGNSESFQKLISATPASMRQEVVASALNDAFTLGSRKEAQLNIPGFVDWYAGAKRNGSLNLVTKHLPDDATKRLNDLYVVANGIRTAKSSEISTGRIQALLDQFDKNGGMISKIYNIGKKAAAAEGVTSSIGVPGVGAASIIASSLTAKKTARTVAADQLIASNQFRDAARVMAGADSLRLASAREGVEKALARSRQYQKWAATLEPAERQAIAKVGIMQWLLGTPSEE